MNQLTLEQLPKLVTDLHKQINNLEQVVYKNIMSQARIDRYPMTIEEASKFLSLKTNTIRQYCNRNIIPYYKIDKKLYFFRIDLIELIKKHKVLSNKEINDSIH